MPDHRNETVAAAVMENIMRKITTTLKLQCIIFAAAIIANSAPALAGEQDVDNAKAMSRGAVKKLYGDKSWIWNEGAGYFRPDGRFYAWSGTDANATYARGRWRARSKGRLCFTAKWRSRSGSSSKSDCFSHRISDGTIYQKREPSGNWYVFRHAETKEGDEFLKLRKGDLVTADYRSTRRRQKKR